MVEIGEQGGPLPKGTGSGFAGRAARLLGEDDASDPAAPSGHDPAGAALAQQGALVRVQLEFTPPAFDPV